MPNWFIGVDFGTVHTKVCLRQDIDPVPGAVIVDAEAGGTGRYLIPSASSSWALREPPKILLCGREELPPHHEALAIHEAARAVATAVRAATQAAETRSSGRHAFMLQLGMPTEEGVMVEAASERYRLVAEEALRIVGDIRVAKSIELLDERLASLAFFDRSKFSKTDEALLVIDGGGWTTHLSFIRWSVLDGESRITVEGDFTATLGIHQVVRSVADDLSCAEADAAESLNRVLRRLYRDSDGGPLVLDARRPRVRGSGAGMVPATAAGGDEAVALAALADFVGSDDLEAAWSDVWRSAFGKSRSARHFTRYRLILAGGAARIGRDIATRTLDPIAERLSSLQVRVGIPFTGATYPELDKRFWTFAPAAPAEVVPYLFVAGGYTFPHEDWPAELKSKVLVRMEFRRPDFELCRCSGLSDSCPFCGGNGFLRPSIRPEPVPVARSKRGPQVSSAPADVFICELCDDIFPSFGSLEHANSHICPDCGERAADVREHRRKAHGYSTCGVCGAFVKSLVVHVRRRHQPPSRVAAPLAILSQSAKKTSAPAPSRKAKAERGTGRQSSTEAESRRRSGSQGSRQGPRREPRPDGPLKHNPFAKLLVKQGE